LNDKKRSKSKKVENNFLSGKGISDIDEKRQQTNKKQKIVIELTEQEKEEITKQIERTLVFSIEIKDVLSFLMKQFIPLIFLTLGMLIPSGFYLFKVSVEIRNMLIILLILGTLIGVYSIVRLLTFSRFKVKITKTSVAWRSVFKWNTLEITKIKSIGPIGGYYFYLPKLGGIFQFGLEIIKLSTQEKTYWIQTYPLHKKRGELLVKSILCCID
jgi:hypothetical protein